MEVSAGRVGFSLLSVQAEAETRARSNRSRKPTRIDPRFLVIAAYADGEKVGVALKKNELMGALQTELMRPG